MRLVGTMATRNEDWVIGASLRIALMWLDDVVVLQHACTDRTAEIVSEIAREHPGRVHVLVEESQEWAEMAQRQRMLDHARGLGATHIAVVDADEVLSGNLLPVIREEAKQIPPGGYMSVGMPCMWRALTRYRVGQSVWSNRHDLMLLFRDTPGLKWQKRNGYDHHQRAPQGSRQVAVMRGGNGGVMHLQFAPWRRLVAKHAGYKCLERLKYPDKPVAEIDRMYSLALDESGIQLADAPDAWWEPYRDLMPLIDLNAEPWQERYVRDMVREHGMGRFSGLNLYGVEADQCAQAA